MSQNNTKADQIWNAIKDIGINLYALSGQTISMHVTRLPIADNMLYLKLKSPAVLPIMEEAIQHVRISSKEKFDEKLEVSQEKDFVIIKPVIDVNAYMK
jgi:hypothetical protein